MVRGMYGRRHIAYQLGVVCWICFACHRHRGCVNDVRRVVKKAYVFIILIIIIVIVIIIITVHKS